MPTARTRAARTQPAIHVTVPANGGKTATGDVRPDPKATQAPAKPAATAANKPAAKREPKQPEGRPLVPVKGGKATIADTKAGVIAHRDAVNGQTKADRILIGEGVATVKVGAAIVTHHGKNLAPTGTWTVLAVIKDGAVASGKAPEGVKAFSVNTVS
jgi:hypothetical protein